MAEIRKHLNKRADLATFEVLGPVHRNEISQFLESSRDSDTARNLFDFRWATLTPLSKKDIKSGVRSARKFSRPGVKTAFVFSNPADFSVGRLISKRVGKEGYPSQTRGFYNPYLATDWLLF